MENQNWQSLNYFSIKLAEVRLDMVMNDFAGTAEFNFGLEIQNKAGRLKN